ncbi:MAG: hypothetical protein U1C74_14460 [Phenylobacterium sp.]|nr:hypothetical protein [Phenylobacterium sp.]
MSRAYRQVRTIAQRFLAHYEPNLPPPDLAAALAACAAEISRRAEIEPDDAYDVALSAWSERSGRATRCYIDLDVSTPWLVFVADPESGARYPIPLADLVRMLGPRLVKQDGKAAGG